MNEDPTPEVIQQMAKCFDMEELMKEDQESTSWMKEKGRTRIKRNARGSREELASTSEEEIKRNPKKSRAGSGREGRRYPKEPGGDQKKWH